MLTSRLSNHGQKFKLWAWAKHSFRSMIPKTGAPIQVLSPDPFWARRQLLVINKKPALWLIHLKITYLPYTTATYIFVTHTHTRKKSLVKTTTLLLCQHVNHCEGNYANKKAENSYYLVHTHDHSECLYFCCFRAKLKKLSFSFLILPFLGTPNQKNLIG